MKTKGEVRALNKALKEVGHKFCNGCNTSKQLSLFGGVNKKDVYCKPCNTAKLEERRDSLLVARKKYRDRNKDSINKKARDRYHNDLESSRERVRKYNRENKEAKAATGRRYRQGNKDVINAATARRRARVLETSEENNSLVNALYTMAQTLSNTCEPMEVDHIIPLSKGGTHTFDNLQILTKEDNRRKGDKLWILKD